MKKFVNINLKNWLYSLFLRLFLYRAKEIKKNIYIFLYFCLFIKRFFSFFFFKLLSICISYKIFLNACSNLDLKDKKLYKINFLKEKYIEKGYKYKKLGIYLKNFITNNNDLYYQNIKNINNFYCYLLIRLNRKNLFLTLLNNEGNVLCKTNIGASGFKKKVKRTGYAIKGTGKNFIKKIKRSLVKSIFVLNKKNIKDVENNNNLFQNKIQNLKILKKKYIYIKKIKKKRKKIIYKKKNKKKKNKINIIKKSSKKIIRSKLLWIKILKNLKKYRIYYYPTLNNLIKKNLRIIFRIKTSLKLWAFRFVVYGLFKKLPWFRGIEFRLPVPHSNSLRLKKKRRV